MLVFIVFAGLHGLLAMQTGVISIKETLEQFTVPERLLAQESLE
mgnify:CR=1 FL=1